MRYESNWYAVREMRIELVKSAHNGDTAAMDELRTLALHAGVFAVLSVHNTVTNQENQYAKWLRGGAITGLGIHVRAVLMGFDNCGCIDSHMFSMLKDAGATALKTVPGTMKAYRTLYAATGWTHTLDQWHAFECVPVFARGQHDVYFASILAMAVIA